MNESILTSIKKLLGIAEEYTHFDQDIIIYINTYLRRLYQVGVGQNGFYIADSSATWDDFLGEDSAKYEQAKVYVYLRVKQIFDPPQSSAANEAIKENIKELEWLLFIEADPPLSEVDWWPVKEAGRDDG